MSNFLEKIPVSPITSFGNPSVPNGSTFGTNFSILQTGGYMEVFSLSGLTYTIPPATTGIIEFSGNSIPIQFTKGSGSIFSPDVLTLNSDNISSGRRKLGMLVYVYETDKIYQYTIDDYETLWNNATGATGPGGPTVVISDFGTTVKNNSPEGIAFINAWTASTIEGIDGYNNANSSWRQLKTAVVSITGGTFNNNTDTLTLNNSTGGTITITGFTDYYTTGFTFNPSTYDLIIQRNDGLPDLLVNLSILSSDVTITGGTYNPSTGTATFTNNTGGTFNVTGFLTGFTDIYVTGGTFNDNTRTLTLTRTDNVNIDISGFTDVFITGGTYSNGTAIFTNNTGGTFNLTGLTTPTLQEVTDAGTVTTNDVQVAGIVLTDFTSLVGDIQIVNNGAFELNINTNTGVRPILNLTLGQIEVASLNGETFSIFTNPNGDSQLLAPVTTGIETIATESYVDFIASQFATISQVVNVLKHNVTPNKLTASANTTETVLDNYDLGVGFLSNYERLVIECNIIKNVTVNGGTQTFFYLSKVANSIAVGNAVKIATSAAILSGGGIGFFKRGLWRLNNKLYTKHPVTIANSNEETNANNIPVVALDDIDIHLYRYLIVTSTYTGTGAPNNMQNNILVYKYPSI